ncbi:lantibiotic dehydratase [Sphingobacterium prati]|uniref:lantibiotic dehydratase n=1 Tax=Sphingobacterium prati TaxID=2737006 RepID=UPI001556AA3C|nr:lantibiotic dehydratase [Sphingobacterium prati]NPE45942.1 lantibiotic dehydratase [Sphingobacterium prati]
MTAFTSEDYFLLRSPLLNLEKITKLMELSDFDAIASELRHIYQDRRLRDAIYLASPNFLNEVEKWLCQNNETHIKIISTLFKYTVRMATRSTPFGLFAGVSLGRINKDNDSELALTRDQADRATLRLDTGSLIEIAELISKDRNIAKELTYYTNPTIYKQGNWYKYYQQTDVKNTLKQVRSTLVLEQILELFDQSQGKVSYKMLHSLLEQRGTTEEQASQYIDKLLQLGLISSELKLGVIGEVYVDQLIRALRKVDTKNRYLPTMLSVAKVLQENTQLQQTNILVTEYLRTHFSDLNSNKIIQADLLLGMAKNQIPHSVINMLEKQLQNLLALNNPKPMGDFERFSTAFQERFGDRMVSLLHALDVDAGIGYGSNKNTYRMMDEVLSDLNNTNGIAAPDKPHRYQKLVNEKFHASAMNRFSEIIITDEDLLGIETTEDQLIPKSFYAFGNLLHRESAEEMLFNLGNIGGSSSGNLFSRFAYLDPKLSDALYKSAVKEQEHFGRTQLAEIAYLPDARLGNILQRPEIRMLTICLAVTPGAVQKQVGINDLYVFAKAGKLYLWSKTFKQIIEPRLTSAHNFSDGMNLYKFLADFQFQNHRLDIGWSWGTLKNQPRLPRVSYKNIILCREQWRLSKIAEIPDTTLGKRSLIADIRQKHMIPVNVVLTNGDNELLLNLDNILCIEMLVEQLAKKEVILTENILDNFKSPVRDINGYSYANELIIPFYSAVMAQQECTPPIVSDLTRNFPLGSNWVYAKIFCGNSMADHLLSDYIPAIIGTLKQEKIAKKWFFIRYNNPRPHIRLRIELFDQQTFHHVVSCLNANLNKLLENGQIAEVSYDTYVREVERYTPLCMEKSEELFYYESELVVQKIQESTKINDRWKLAFDYIDCIFENAGLTWAERRDFCKNMYGLYHNEFGNERQMRIQLNQKFKLRKHWFDELVLQSLPLSDLAEMNQVQSEIFRLIKSKEPDLVYSQTAESLLSSYIHMFVNRLFMSDQRLYELVIYHFMMNFYRMRIGKYGLPRHEAINV